MVRGSFLSKYFLQNPYFSFLHKKWLYNHSDKQIVHNTKNTLEYLTTYSADLPNWPKYLGCLKKISLGVRSPWVRAGLLSAIYILTTAMWGLTNVSQGSSKEFRRGPILVKLRSLSNFIQNRYIPYINNGGCGQKLQVRSQIRVKSIVIDRNLCWTLFTNLT